MPSNYLRDRGVILLIDGFARCNALFLYNHDKEPIGVVNWWQDCESALVTLLGIAANLLN